MKKFMYIFHVDGPVDMDGETGKATEAWFESIGDKMVDGGNPFNPDSEAHIAGGKVDMQPDTAAGYTLVNAENLEEAVKMAMACPFADMPGCSVKVYETMAM